MRYRWTVPVFFLILILQGTLFNVFAVRGSTPNAILCAVILSALLYDNSRPAVLVSIFCALLYDFSFSAYVGPSALAVLVVYLLLKLATVFLNSENTLNALVMSAGASFVFQILYRVPILIPSGLEMTAIFNRLPSFIIYNSIIVVLVHFFVMKRRHRVVKGDFTGGLYI